MHYSTIRNYCLFVLLAFDNPTFRQVSTVRVGIDDPSSTISRNELGIRYGHELNRSFKQYEKTTQHHSNTLSSQIPSDKYLSIIAKRASKALIRRMNIYQLAKIRFAQQGETIKIKSMINEQDSKDIHATVRRSYRKTNEQLKENRLALFTSHRDATSIDPSKTVINLSSKLIP